MFARRRPQSSGSAQFCGILGERLLAPVSDEKKSMKQQKQQQKPEQKRNGWPDAKIERTDGMRVLSSMFVANDRISD
jgi:hypothetical protein